ncbi:MAG: type phosphodiesterase/nucleotide pyrophosphatase [Deltaproteobacteria bacterium]|nr:type phosphodiesterase/nucleotide pyrophosphatase [Deltaproteobacteria bacterium]
MSIMNSRLLILGLDGGTFDVLLPWMQKGLLPNLRKIYDEGVSGPLRTIVPPITAPAWTSFYTGKNPGKHGIFEFLVKRENSYQEIAVNSTFCKSKTLWDYLAEENKKVAVLNVPMTYPPQKVNGVMICDFLSQAEKRDFTYPPQLLTEVEDRFGPYYHALIDDCVKMSEYKFRVAHYLMEKDSYDVVVFHELGTDRMQHWLWNVIDPSHPRHTKELEQKFYGKVLDFYQRVDEQIGKTLQLAGPDCSVFIMSDHGLGPVNRSIDLNTWLLQEGYITLKKSFASRARYLLWKCGVTYQNIYAVCEKLLRLGLKPKTGSPGEFLKQWHKMLNQSPLLSLNDIDWTKTRAYAKTSVIGQIIINLKGREPQGMVAPGEEYNQLLAEMVQKLKQLHDPGEGTHIKGLVYTGQEAYRGPFVNFAGQRGAHTMDGIFMARGREIKRGAKVSGASIIDVAPTALHLMGCKVPSDMDGKVLEDIFEEAFLRQHPVEFVQAVKDTEEAQSAMSPEEEKTVMERLRNLGYID